MANEKNVNGKEVLEGVNAAESTESKEKTYVVLSRALIRYIKHRGILTDIKT